MGGLAAQDSLGIGQRVVSNCIVHHLFVYIIISSTIIIIIITIISLS